MAIQLPALDIQAPQQQPGALDQYAKAVQLKSLLGNQQLQQQQLIGAQQENQMRAQQIQDNMTLRNSAKGMDWNDPTTFGKWINNAQEKGVSPQMLSQLALQRAQYNEQLAKTDIATLGADSIRTNKLLGHLDAIKQDPSSAQMQASQILNDGEVKDPNTLQMIQAVAKGLHKPTPQELTTMEIGLTDHKTQVEQQLKQREVAAQEQTAQAKVQESQNVANRLQAEMPGGPMQPVEQKELSDYMAKNPGKGPIDFAKFKAGIAPAIRNYYANTGGGMIPGGGGAGGGSSAGAGGQSAPAPDISKVPTQIRGTVQQILDYRGPMPSSARNNPNNMAIRYWVNQMDPTYDESSFPARNKILQSYTSGKESKSINAINTALGHLGELGTAAQALSQNDIPLLHSIASKVGAAEGGTAETTYQSILHRVSPEMTAAYVQGGGGEGERGANEGDFALNKGAKQITANVAESAKLLRSKISAQENQWNTTFRPTKEADQFQNRFITPAAKATLDKFSSQAPTSGGGSAKVLSMSAIQKAAKDHGVSVDEAKKQAQAAGYTVQ